MQPGGGRSARSGKCGALTACHLPAPWLGILAKLKACCAIHSPAFLPFLGLRKSPPPELPLLPKQTAASSSSSLCPAQRLHPPVSCKRVGQPWRLLLRRQRPGEWCWRRAAALRLACGLQPQPRRTGWAEWLVSRVSSACSAPMRLSAVLATNPEAHPQMDMAAD